MSEDIGKYIVIAFVLLFGFLFWRAWQIRQHSPQWPFVEGEITVSRVYTRSQYGAAATDPNQDWLVEVNYRYQVNGQSYTGNRLTAFGRNPVSQQDAEAEIAPFPVGARVKVYYDPAKPSVSVLSPG
ncbi:MAG TPA: DUF3592 domain-containing protein [Aquabacterium sp.]|nr:DUF3592 domain-containing protein [Aquabacterium sp.]